MRASLAAGLITILIYSESHGMRLAPGEHIHEE